VKRLMMKKIKLILKSLSAQLIIYYTVISIVILAIGSILSYSYIMKIFNNNTEKYLLQQLSQSDYNISTLFTDVNRLSTLFIQNENIQQFLLENNSIQDYPTVMLYRNIIASGNEIIGNYSYINSIYVLTDGGDEIGTSVSSTYIMTKNSDSNSFYSSELYQKVKSNFPANTLYGGKKPDYYNQNLKYSENEDDNYIISVARVVKSPTQPNKSLILVFNVDEKYISSIYSSNFSKTNEHMYIVDSTGKIVSSDKSEEINTQSNAFKSIAKSKAYGSFVSNNGSNNEQIVYYKLNGTDWYLVDEIPLKYLSMDVTSIQNILIIIFFMSILATFIVSFIWLKKILKPLNILSEKMNAISNGRLGITLHKFPKNEIGALIISFNKMSVSIADLVKANNEIQEDKTKLEIEALQAQINPHFLYNTLNMIKWMAMIIHADNIVESIIALGNLLHPLFRDNSRIWTLREELDYLENYLKITCWRYGNQLDFKISVPEEHMDVLILKFSFQPLIENTVVHGISAQKKVTIDISSYEENGMIVFAVSDNGFGIPEERLNEINNAIENETNVKQKNRESVGLYNVNKRIKLNFGSQYGLRIESKAGEYTRTLARIPANRILDKPADEAENNDVK
jgi:two-component system sensor histidine kinase YesM